MLPLFKIIQSVIHVTFVSRLKLAVAAQKSYPYQDDWMNLC
jgi:hypothetical protein